MPSDAKIRERLAQIETLLEWLPYDIKNNLMVLDSFVPRKQHDGAVEQLDERIERLEKDKAALTRWVVGAWLAGTASCSRRSGQSSSADPKEICGWPVATARQTVFTVQSADSA